MTADEIWPDGGLQLLPLHPIPVNEQTPTFLLLLENVFINTYMKIYRFNENILRKASNRYNTLLGPIQPEGTHSINTYRYGSRSILKMSRNILFWSFWINLHLKWALYGDKLPSFGSNGDLGISIDLKNHDLDGRTWYGKIVLLAINLKKNC